MADFLDMLLFLDFADYYRKNRVYKCRRDPFTDYDDDEFRRRFRLSKHTVTRVHEEVISMREI
jgi:transposase